MKLKNNNRLKLITSSLEYIHLLKEKINSAQESIFLETYIFAHDWAGQTITQALIEAAQRNVAVYLILDGFGAKNVLHDFLKRFIQHQVHCLFYRPERSIFSFKKRRLRRTHRKLVVIDQTTAFVGGMNIDADPPGTQRLDFTIQIQGEIVPDILKSMLRQWEILSWSQGFGRQRCRLQIQTHFNYHFSTLENAECAFLLRDNLKHRHEILNSYLRAIQSAQKEILIANAYFFPSFSFLRALSNAAQKGIQIHIILQGNSNQPFLRNAMRFLYHRLTQQGIFIHEYQPGLLHAKVAVIDERWATVGSSNIDPSSLLLNKEANVLVIHPPFAAELKKNLLQTVEKHCTHCLPYQKIHFGRLQMLKHFLAYCIVCTILNFLGYTDRKWDGH